MRAVVFAYHTIGVRCIEVLLAHHVDIALVVSHADNPLELIWFDSVTKLCQEHGIACITPDDVKSPALFEQIKALDIDCIFSFYYRYMIPPSILSLAKDGAYNMHGSLLPKYRGRVPVNWAVLHGETQTGVTLHEMTEKPDAGAIVAQTAVPILPDETAHDVFNKLTIAAKETLDNILPSIIAHRAPRLVNDLSQGSYFGGRKPEDGKINWEQSAQAVYNLHRAVAPPYPGAFTQIGEHTFTIESARLYAPKDEKLAIKTLANLPKGLAVVDNVILGVCGDGRALHVTALRCDDQVISPQALAHFLYNERKDLIT